MKVKRNIYLAFAKTLLSRTFFLVRWWKFYAILCGSSKEKFLCWIISYCFFLITHFHHFLHFSSFYFQKNSLHKITSLLFYFPFVFKSVFVCVYFLFYKQTKWEYIVRFVLWHIKHKNKWKGKLDEQGVSNQQLLKSLPIKSVLFHKFQKIIRGKTTWTNMNACEIEKESTAIALRINVRSSHAFTYVLFAMVVKTERIKSKIIIPRNSFKIFKWRTMQHK